jgi:DNA-binding LytR/AlgR family response regulator
MMQKIAIIEDNPRDLEQILGFLTHYQQEHNLTFSVISFKDPMKFLSEYRPDYDLIFMDIELPPFNGIDIARRLRETDPVVALVFITNMEQCAVNGYEVDALDFVVKPINYYRFSSMMGKALRSFRRRSEKEIVIRSSSKIARLPISQIFYVEIRDHLLIYHSTQGNLEAWGKLSDLEKELLDFDFVRCSSSYLVNLRHIISVDGDTVNIAGDRLPISQRRRKTFYNDVTNYLSGR